MQLVLHCVAENNQMAAKWDGVLISFFKKIHPPKKKTTNKQNTKNPNQPNKKPSKQFKWLPLQDACRERWGAEPVVAGKTKCADTLNLHVTTIFACHEISAAPQATRLGRLSILKIKICCLISSHLPCSCSYSLKVAVEVVVISSPMTTSLNLSERSLVQLSQSSRGEELHRCPQLIKAATSCTGHRWLRTRLYVLTQ